MFNSVLRQITANDVKLQKLTLDNMPLTEREVQSLGVVLINNTHIKSIQLRNCSLTDEMILSLCAALKSSNLPLMSLDVDDNPRLSGMAFAAISKLWDSRLAELKEEKIDGVSLEKLAKAVTTIPNTRDKDIVLVLGKANSGKSLLLSYLLGCHDFRVVRGEDGDVQLSVTNSTTMRLPAVSSAWDTNTCIYPEIFRSPIGIDYCDTPGYGKIGLEAQLLTAIGQHRAIQAARTIRGALVVIEDSVLIAPLNAEFRDILLTLFNLLQDVEEAAPALYFLFNLKNNPNLTSTMVIARIKKFRESLEKSDALQNDDPEIKVLHTMLSFLEKHADHILTINPLDDKNTEQKEQGLGRRQVENCCAAMRGIPKNLFAFAGQEKLQRQIQTFAKNELLSIGRSLLKQRCKDNVEIKMLIDKQQELKLSQTRLEKIMNTTIKLRNGTEKFLRSLESELAEQHLEQKRLVEKKASNDAKAEEERKKDKYEGIRVQDTQSGLNITSHGGFNLSVHLDRKNKTIEIKAKKSYVGPGCSCINSDGGLEVTVTGGVMYSRLISRDYSTLSITDSHAPLEDLEGSIVRLNAAITNLNRGIEDTTSKVAKLNGEIVTKQASLAKITDELTRTDQQLLSVRNSYKSADLTLETHSAFFAQIIKICRALKLDTLANSIKVKSFIAEYAKLPYAKDITIDPDPTEAKAAPASSTASTSANMSQSAFAASSSASSSAAPEITSTGMFSTRTAPITGGDKPAATSTPNNSPS